jgi:cytochrome P450 family 109
VNQDVVTSEIPFDEFKADPVRVGRQWRNQGAIVYSPDVDRWLVTGYDNVVAVLRAPAAASGERGESSQTLINRNGAHHREPRRGVLTGMASDIVGAFEPEIRSASSASVLAALAEGHTDAVRSLSWSVSNNLFRLLFGGSNPDARLRSGWNEGITNHSFLDVPQSTQWLATRMGLRRAKRMLLDPSYQDYQAVRRYVEHHFMVSKDAIDVTPLTRALLDLHASGTLTREDLTAIGAEFVFATSEAPSAMLSGLLMRLVADQDLYHKMREDFALIEPFVEEVLRFESPAQWLRRTLVDDLEIGGVLLPRGAVLLALVSAANRDEEKFANADQFDPGRSPNPHIAFGMGPHSCPGGRLARLEARIFLEEFLKHVSSLQRQNPNELDEYRWVFAIRSLSRLNVSITA